MAMNNTVKKTLRIAGLLLPVIFIAIFLLFPVFSVLIDGIYSDGKFTFEFLKEVFSNGFYYKLFAFTLSQALLSTVVTLILGIPIGYIFGRYDFPGRNIFRIFFTVPFVLPSVLVGMGFLNLFTEEGLFGSPLLSIVLAHAFYNIPLVVLYFSSYYENFDRDLISAAKTLQSKPIHTFFRVYLPIFLQPIITAAMLTFNFSFLSFGLILFLGAPALFRTVEVQIYSEYLPGETGIASALAIMQLLVTIAYVIIFLVIIRRNNNSEKSITTSAFPREKLIFKKIFRKFNGWILLFFFVLGFLLEIVPMISILIFSFISKETSSLTLENYTNLFNSAFLNIPFPFTVLNTFLFALGGALFASLLAILTVIVLGRQQKEKRILAYETITYLPLAISSITLSLGILYTFENVPFFVNHPWFFIIISHGLLGYPFVTRALLNGLNTIDPEMEDAASVLGAKFGYKLKKIYLPLLLPSLIAGFIFAFGLSIGEFTITNIFFSSP
ncbi:MAG: ABC transporter permease, partial [Candidatus Thorarchaeota archaeon]